MLLIRKVFIIAVLFFLINNVAFGETNKFLIKTETKTTPELSFDINEINNKQQSELSLIRSAQDGLSERITLDHMSLIEANRHLDKISNDAHYSYISSTLNIIGMIVGILGGVLLAGAQLSANQEKINIISKASLLDLSLNDKNKEPILNFFGLMGSLLIALGFVIQLLGSLVTAPYSLVVCITIGFLSILALCVILSFFLGYSPNQTRSEKITILNYNFKKHIIYPLVEFVFRRKKVKCYICQKNLNHSEAKIWWLYEENSPKYPYLYLPYNFRLGDKECFDADECHIKIKKHDSLLLAESTPQEFINTHAPNFECWFDKYHEHESQTRNSKSKETSSEEEIKHILKEISKFKIPFQK
ncbi:UNVERIFIED_ORG: lipid-A-disaccharide synthase-like uncharacterized protein [Rahnella aquatilis]